MEVRYPKLSFRVALKCSRYQVPIYDLSSPVQQPVHHHSCVNYTSSKTRKSEEIMRAVKPLRVASIKLCTVNYKLQDYLHSFLIKVSAVLGDIEEMSQ